MGELYASGYLKDNIIDAVDRVIEVVKEHGIVGHAAALRWNVHHSALTADRHDASTLR